MAAYYRLHRMMRIKSIFLVYPFSKIDIFGGVLSSPQKARIYAILRNWKSIEKVVKSIYLVYFIPKIDIFGLPSSLKSIFLVVYCSLTKKPVFTPFLAILMMAKVTLNRYFWFTSFLKSIFLVVPSSDQKDLSSVGAVSVSLYRCFWFSMP